MTTTLKPCNPETSRTNVIKQPPTAYHLLMRHLLLPLLAWFAFICLASSDFISARWEIILIVFAALNLVPPGLSLLLSENDRPDTWWQWGAILLFCAAWLFENPIFSTVSMLPYVSWAVYLSFKEWGKLWYSLDSSTQTALQRRSAWVRLAALSWWATGAVFALFVVTGYQPFGFDPMLIALTAAHFHVAGFVLTIIVYALDRSVDNRLTNGLAWGTVVGMPLVATGIVFTKLGWGPTLEWCAALGFAAMAICVALLQLKMAIGAGFVWPVRFLWILAGVSLLGGALLATAYALRFHFHMPWVSIPHMKIWHGTLNTLGFAFLSLWGWQLAGSSEPLSPYRRWYAL